DTSLGVCFSIRPPPRPPLFPYTTLFRSQGGQEEGRARTRRQRGGDRRPRCRPRPRARADRVRRVLPVRAELHRGAADPDPRRRRSEEHTSELQSRENLVCRLLLEKKKKR